MTMDAAESDLDPPVSVVLYDIEIPFSVQGLPKIKLLRDTHSESVVDFCSKNLVGVEEEECKHVVQVIVGRERQSHAFRRRVLSSFEQSPSPRSGPPPQQPYSHIALIGLTPTHISYLLNTSSDLTLTYDLYDSICSGHSISSLKTLLSNRLTLRCGDVQLSISHVLGNPRGYDFISIDYELIEALYEEQYTVLSDVASLGGAVFYRGCRGGHKRIVWRHFLGERDGVEGGECVWGDERGEEGEVKVEEAGEARGGNNEL